ncbi:MAG TPA: glycosyltransferase [Pedobacter sp.]|jgi:glycosyltransferase involved in cell wall biosynthesis
MPQLSIVIPVFNKGEFIDSCIDSIVRQTFSDFELILVDDGSTDDSGDRCDAWALSDTRIKVVHQLNGGVSSARNKGVQMASGTFIGFADGDDTLEPDMYEMLLSNAKEFNADVSICGVRKIFPQKVELYSGTKTIKIYNRTQALAGLLKKEFLRSVYDKIYNADIAKSVKFEGSINEDIFYNYLIFNEAKKTVFDDTIKYNYIIRDNSVSMTGFSKKWMDTISFSERIVKMCRAKTPELLDEAINFDLITNISLLNLILLSGKSRHIEDYQLVATNMSSYATAMKLSVVRKKHKYAYHLFNISPIAYEVFMKIYCKLTNADVSNKT